LEQLQAQRHFPLPYAIIVRFYHPADRVGESGSAAAAIENNTASYYNKDVIFFTP
jgi:hypothetical protein